MFGRWEDWKFEEAKQDGAHYGTKRMLRRVGPYVSKGIIVFSAYLIASLSLLGGVSLGVPVPPEVKSVVAFIFIQDDGDKMLPNGTGFFVGVKNPTDQNSYAVYFVTAKHVLYKPNTTNFLDKIFVRLNRKGGGSQVGSIPLVISGEKRNVFVHVDPSVDLAAIPFLPDQDKFDFKFLQDELLTTKESFDQLKIREGSDVFFTGLFTPYIGSQKNYPVVRFGRVALITDEKIEWQGKLTDLYFIEAGSYGGNSGSPVFFYLGSDREPGSLIVGSPILRLAGIMQGTFLDAQEIRVIGTAPKPISVSSMGIAAVVSAYKLHELLNGAEIKAKRRF